MSKSHTSLPRIRGVAQFLGRGYLVHNHLKAPAMPLITTHWHTPCVPVNTNHPQPGLAELAGYNNGDYNGK